MTWFAQFHVTWVEIAFFLMAISGASMARSLWRQRTAPRRHPANRPYDWARECPRLRQAVTVRRRIS